MWSPVEKTALAEAEVEYEDLTSARRSTWRLRSSNARVCPELVGAHAVIWTTTPWTIPVNQALAYGADVEYVLVQTASMGVVGWGEQEAASNANPGHKFFGRKFVLAAPFVEALETRIAST